MAPDLLPIQPPKATTKIKSARTGTSGRRGSKTSSNNRQPPVENRVLSEEDELHIIDYWKKNYVKYSKSNKTAFARDAAVVLNRQYFPQDPVNSIPIHPEQLEKRIQYWLDRYKEVAKQFQDSGFGLTEKDPDTLKEVAERKLRHFHELHSFLACKPNVNPTFLLQTQRDGEGDHVGVNRAYGQLGLPASETAKPVEDEAEEDISVRLTGEITSEDENAVTQPGTGSIPANAQKRASPSAEAPTKRKRLSGAEVINRLVAEPGNVDVLPAVPNSASPGTYATLSPSPGRTVAPVPPTVGKSDRENRNSSSRLKMVNDLYATQMLQIEAQNETISKTVKFLETDNGYRQREVDVLERTAVIKENEAKYFAVQQPRLNKEEDRRQREELRKENEEKRRQS